MMTERLYQSPNLELSPCILAESENSSIIFNSTTGEIVRNGEIITRLTKCPAKLLQTLINDPNRYVSIDSLALSVWQDNYKRVSAVHNLVSRIRKIFVETSEPLLAKRIGSSKYRGYVWVSNQSEVSKNTSFRKNI